MGAENNVMNRYLSDKRRFADLINVVYYEGRQVIDPNDLTEISGTTYEVLVRTRKGKRPKRQERRNDIAMRYADRKVFRIYLTENQEYVNYILPIRDIEYLSAGYMKQLGQIRKRHEEANDLNSFAEWASGVSKTDRLKPIYLMWLYHGEAAWDGPRTLKDMMEFGEEGEAKSGFLDYTPRLVCVNEMDGYDSYRTELKELFQILGCRDDRKEMKKLFEADERFQHLDADTMEAASVLMHAPSIWKNRKKYMNRIAEKEEYNMCQALREWEAEIREEFAEEMEATKAELEKERKEKEEAQKEACAYLKLLKEHGIDPDSKQKL